MPDRRRHPNYNSRGVQWRLLVLVGSLMFVLVMIEEARKPQYYEWMWKRGSHDHAPHASSREGLPPRETGSPRALPEQADTSDSEPGHGGRHGRQPPHDDAHHREPAEAIASQHSTSERTSPTAADERRRAISRDAWQYLVENLTESEVYSLTMALLRAGDELPPTDELRSSLPPILRKLDAGWNRYRDTALASLRASGPERTGWRDAIVAVSEQWFSSGRTALQTWAQSSDRIRSFALSPLLVDLQSELDRVNLKRIRDHSVFSQSESPAWFRLYARLRTPSELGPALEVTYLQLMNQPEHYRGKYVTLRGTVREARRVPATENAAGVTEYFVLWLKPDGANAPLVAYCRHLPPRFPRVADRALGEAPTRVNIDVELKGYFFKLLSYPGQRRIEAAPLLLVDTPRVLVESADAEMPGDPILVLIAGAAFGMMAVALIRLWSHRQFRTFEFPEKVELPPPAQPPARRP